MHGWITGQLAVSGGELAASGGSHLFHSPQNRSNFAAGFRRDALSGTTLATSTDSKRTSSNLSRQAETVFFFSQNKDRLTADVGRKN